MNLNTGFFMAWGNFLTLPCPLKRWDKDLKNYMLSFLPSVGLIIGVLWAAFAFILCKLALASMLAALLLSFIPFGLCGFIHLDGFMDCSDAIMSRRPLEDRQRILKDPNTGAFAVVSVIFLLLGVFCAVYTLWEQFTASDSYLASPSESYLPVTVSSFYISFCLIPVISRAVSGLHVLLCHPIGHSQYATGAGAANRAEKRKAVALVLIQVAIYLTIGLCLTNDIVITLMTTLITVITIIISIAFARRQLGGMSGDIAGYGIVWGELLGLLTMAILL